MPVPIIWSLYKKSFHPFNKNTYNFALLSMFSTLLWSLKIQNMLKNNFFWKFFFNLTSIYNIFQGNYYARYKLYRIMPKILRIMISDPGHILKLFVFFQMTSIFSDFLTILRLLDRKNPRIIDEYSVRFLNVYVLWLKNMIA